MTDLPGVLGEIALVAGEDSAIAIAKARGGTQVYVPPSPADDHWLTRLVGREKAQRIADKLTCGVGGLRVDLPLGPAGHGSKQSAKVDAMLDQDLSERDIALATGYTTRAVRWRRARRRRRRDDRQLNLL